MKKLTTADIKCIIQEKGTNLFEVIVDVSRTIFSSSESEQTDIITTRLFGFPIQSKIVKQVLFYGKTDDYDFVKIKATIEISESAIEELEQVYLNFKKYSETAAVINYPRTILELKEFVDKNINTFILKVSNLLTTAEVEKHVSQLLNPSVNYEQQSILSTNVYDKSTRTIIVTIADFEEKILAAVKAFELIQACYNKIDTDAIPLYRPLNEEELDLIIQSKIKELGISENEFYETHSGIIQSFKYLVEIEYSSEHDEDESTYIQELCGLVFDSELISEIEFPDFEATTVGHNDENGDKIVEVVGSFRIPLW